MILGNLGVETDHPPKMCAGLGNVFRPAADELRQPALPFVTLRFFFLCAPAPLLSSRLRFFRLPPPPRWLTRCDSEGGGAAAGAARRAY